MSDPPRFQRLEILSRSESGLHFVRDRKTGIVRTLTDDELRDLNDPPPCEECGEQFGCEHYNCAGERVMGDDEVEADVPPEWREFARDTGVSRNDVARLQAITRTAEGTHQAGPDGDMRAVELALLLDETLLAR